MGAFLAILRREIASYFYAPIAYVVAVAFLSLSGLSFWALMKALSDPSLPAAPGAVLRGFFGGTMLHWLVVFALVSLLSMRSVAEDRRTGMWEATLTTRVSVWQVLVAKWLALLTFYTLLWIPTVGLIAILNLYVPDGVSLDLGPILASYIGVLGIGAALLAIGLALSTVTENQIVAAVGCFAILLAWLMAGEMELVGGAWNLRGLLDAAARGELRLSGLATMAATIAASLAGATAMSALGRQPGGWAWLRVTLVLVIGVGMAIFTERHDRAVDLSAGKVNQLDDETRRVLRQLREPVQIVVIRPEAEVFDSVYDELSRLLRNMQEHQPILAVSELSPLEHPEKVAEWSFELAIRREDFASGGAVLIRMGQRRRSIDLLGMASFAADDLGVGSLSELRAESAIRNALLELGRARRETLCTSAGHGELSPRVEAMASESWEPIASRLERDGVLLIELRTLDSRSLEGCDALVLLGLQSPLAPSEILALEGYRTRGGGLLVALRSRPSAGELLALDGGLLLLLEQAGVHVEQAQVVDPSAELELRPAWHTYEGYGEHPIVADFRERRATIWDSPWALTPMTPETSVLVEASPRGWAERSLETLRSGGTYSKDEEDLDARVVAVASESPAGARLVAFGSAEAFSALWSARGIGGNERLLVSSIHWLLRPDEDPLADRHLAMTPERIRLLMSRSQLQRAFVLCVFVGPLLLALLGICLWWWRRREP